LKCPIENATILDKYIAVLSGMSSVGDSTDAVRNEQRVEESVNMAVRLAQGPLARL